jgi:predicted porin
VVVVEAGVAAIAAVVVAAVAAAAASVNTKIAQNKKTQASSLRLFYRSQIPKPKLDYTNSTFGLCGMMPAL